MNKNKLMQLNDYVKDKSKVRLEIFIEGAKVNKKHLTLAIDDWVKTPTPQRLKIIEAFLATQSPQPINKQPINPSNKLTKLLGKKALLDPKNIEMQEKRREIEAMARSRSEGSRQSLAELTNELYDMEVSAGLIQTKPVEMWTEEERREAINKSNASLVTGALGDWKQEGTFAYEILYGSRPRFTITRDFIGTPQHAVSLLEEISGKQARKFTIVTLVGNGAKPVYEFTDNLSGLSPSSNNSSAYIPVK